MVYDLLGTYGEGWGGEQGLVLSVWGVGGHVVLPTPRPAFDCLFLVCCVIYAEAYLIGVVFFSVLTAKDDNDISLRYTAARHLTGLMSE